MVDRGACSRRSSSAQSRPIFKGPSADRIWQSVARTPALVATLCRTAPATQRNDAVRIAERCGPHRGTIRSASSRASAFLLQPSVRISAAWRSARPTAELYGPHDRERWCCGSSRQQGSAPLGAAAHEASCVIFTSQIDQKWSPPRRAQAKQ
jgi:hypothetical protein